VDQPVRRQHGERLIVDVVQQRQHVVVPRIALARPVHAALLAVAERRLVAVVPIRDGDRTGTRGGQQRLHRGAPIGISGGLRGDLARFRGLPQQAQPAWWCGVRRALALSVGLSAAATALYKRAQALAETEQRPVGDVLRDMPGRISADLRTLPDDLRTAAPSAPPRE